ncbi:unnamed protein product [Diplocarpon coronariae]|nr:hypothetical protein JHW43_002353 [Diplocarpon mali]
MVPRSQIFVWGGCPSSDNEPNPTYPTNSAALHRPAYAEHSTLICIFEGNGDPLRALPDAMLAACYHRVSVQARTYPTPERHTARWGSPSLLTPHLLTSPSRGAWEKDGAATASKDHVGDHGPP